MVCSHPSSIVARKSASARPPGFRTRPLAAMLCALALAAMAPWAHATGNLLVNGDAESAPGSDAGDVVPVPGWTVTAGNFTAITYNPNFGGVEAGSPGPVDRGLNYFGGGPSIELSVATQTIDLAFAAADIASGQAGFELSGWLGGFSSQDDNAVLSATFLDGANNALSSFSIGPVLAADRENVTGLLFRSLTGSIPAGTGSALITLTLTRLQGSYDDGYADNLSFSLQPVPEPGTAGLLLGGAAVLAFLGRRRHA